MMITMVMPRMHKEIKLQLHILKNISATICGKDGTYLAAENINGVNSVIWRYDDPYGLWILPSG